MNIYPTVPIILQGITVKKNASLGRAIISLLAFMDLS